MGTQVILFSLMVYKHFPNLCKMKDGRTHSYWSRRSLRRDPVSLQKEQNGWTGGIWGACDKNTDHEGGWRFGGNANDENLPVANRLERSVPTRGPTRRAYQICVLETRYPCQNPADASEPEESGPCKYEDGTGEPAGSFYGNKPIANACFTTEKEKPRTKRVCRNNRRTINDSICSRVLQALGDDLIVEWLTPEELHNTEIAFECDFDWGRVWHGGKVKDKKTAARIHHDLQRGLQISFVLEKYDRDLAFSAFWYVLDMKDLIQVAHQYSHYKTIRKLCYFN